MTALAITKDILYFGKEVVVGCDANCAKAWGITTRPSLDLDPAEPEDIVYLADAELGDAPIDPGTYEGGHAKPTALDQRLNKWCVRACERSAMRPRGEPLRLPDYSRRRFNMPERHSTEATSDPAFRAWQNMLKAPRFLDKDVLLAAGVIADDSDWQLWQARGWYAFMMRSVVTDAQHVALFGLVQRELKRAAFVANDLSSLTHGDVVVLQADEFISHQRDGSRKIMRMPA